MENGKTSYTSPVFLLKLTGGDVRWQQSMSFRTLTHSFSSTREPCLSLTSCTDPRCPKIIHCVMFRGHEGACQFERPSERRARLRALRTSAGEFPIEAFVEAESCRFNHEHPDTDKRRSEESGVS